MDIGTVGTKAVAWTNLPERFGLPVREVATDELRVRGLLVLSVLATLAWSPRIALSVGVTGWFLPRLLEQRAAARRDRAVRAELSLAVDLMALCARSGSPVPRCVTVVGANLGGPVGRAFAAAGARMAAAVRVDTTLAALADELGPPADELVAVLRSAYLDGEPLAPSLQRLAERLREDRRREGEARARRLSVRLLIPLVCCSLPGFVCVAVAPVLLDSVGVLAP